MQMILNDWRCHAFSISTQCSLRLWQRPDNVASRRAVKIYSRLVCPAAPSKWHVRHD